MWPFALFAVVVLLTSGIRVVPEDQRLAVVRLGRYLGVRGPGIVVVLPLIDRAVRFVLDRDIPAWRSLSAEELQAAIRHRLNV